MSDRARPIQAFAEFELDEDRRELRCRGQPVRLRRRPLELLRYLVRHRDRVVSRAELLDALWPSVSVSECSLTSAMRDVRRALRQSGRDRELIRTHHGFGYRFTGTVVERPREPEAPPQEEAEWDPGSGGLAPESPSVDEEWAVRFSQRLLRFVLRELEGRPEVPPDDARARRLAS